MGIRTGKLALLLPLLTLGFLLPLRAWAGCEKDTDCKGDRVCQNGACVDASSVQPAPSPSYPPSAPPPSYPPPPPSYPPPVPYAAPPPPYPAVPPPYAVPPPPPAPRWTYPRLHGARSFVAIGGVGDFLSPDFGGVNAEAQATFRVFNAGILDGGLTVNILDDLSFAQHRALYPVYESIAGGVGFDLGVLKVLQFGPRVNVGYGSDISNTIQLYGGFVSFGGHAIGWVSRYIGIYVEVDGLFPMENFAPSGVRFAGGLAFAWD